MKLTKLLPSLLAIVAISFTACKKDKVADQTEFETTFELSANQGVSDNLLQDANEVLNEAAYDKNLQGVGKVGDVNGTTGILSCATVTVTPLTGFPKNIVIDFGAGCTSPNGVTRRGKILVTLTDSLRRPGSVATMNFENYFVNIFKKEGTVVWTNTSTATVKSWNRVCTNGKITNTVTNKYWLHSGTQNVIQIAGANTPLVFADDEFNITGNRTVTNEAGNTRVGTILTPLHKKAICDNIDKGTVQIQGPSHIAIIDYGNGDCDNQATISIDGRTPRTFTLC
ncbi:MAG: hypothetical protein ABL929_05330 [Ferruginibacter sp.]|nr:hypothetical protein [Ferruginibacter sp.]